MSSGFGNVVARRSRNSFSLLIPVGDSVECSGCLFNTSLSNLALQSTASRQSLGFVGPEMVPAITSFADR